MREIISFCSFWFSFPFWILRELDVRVLFWSQFISNLVLAFEFCNRKTIPGISSCFRVLCQTLFVYSNKQRPRPEAGCDRATLVGRIPLPRGRGRNDGCGAITQVVVAMA